MTVNVNDNLFESNKEKKRNKAVSHQSTADFLRNGGKITRIKQGVTGYKPNISNASQRKGGGSNKKCG